MVFSIPNYANEEISFYPVTLNQYPSQNFYTIQSINGLKNYFPTFPKYLIPPTIKEAQANVIALGFDCDGVLPLLVKDNTIFSTGGTIEFDETNPLLIYCYKTIQVNRYLVKNFGTSKSPKFTR